MGMFSGYFVMILESALSSLVIAFIAVSIVRFIVDGIKAKRENRKRRRGVKIMFVIAVSLAGLLVLAVIAYIVLLCYGIYAYAFLPR